MSEEKCQLHKEKLAELENRYNSIYECMKNLTVEVGVLKSKIEHSNESMTSDVDKLYERFDNFSSELLALINSIRSELSEIKSDIFQKFVTKSDLTFILFLVGTLVTFLTFLINYFIKVK